MLRARRAIQELREYRPPLGGRVGLRLDFNENTVGASPRVLQCLRELTLEQLARYPERESVEVALAEFFRVRPEELLLTNGVDTSVFKPAPSITSAFYSRSSCWHSGKS